MEDKGNREIREERKRDDDGRARDMTRWD